MKFKNSIIVSIMFVLFISMIPIQAEENYSDAPNDWAFTPESRPLETAIINFDGTIDSNGDGYISIPEANAVSRYDIRVARLGVTGTLDGIEHFTKIRHIELSHNELSGEIPSDISNLTLLNGLSLSNNNLTGTIPSGIVSLTNLTQFRLNGNSLSGEIPQEIGALKRLSRFDVEHNELSGEIPESFSELNNLTTMDLRYNNFTGLVPDIGKMTKLAQLTLSHNNFSGNIPESYVDNDKLKTVDLHQNSDLHGTTEEIFKDNDSLTYLDVRHTSMSQVAPDLESLKSENGFFGYDLLNHTETDLFDFVTQEIVDDQKTRVAKITNPISKQDLQVYLDKTQIMLTARTAVNALMIEPDYTSMKADVSQENIDDAAATVSSVVDGELKERLNTRLTLVQNIFDTTKHLELLVDENDYILDTVDQEDIDEFKNHVESLHESESKNDLIKASEKLQNEYNLREEALDAVSNMFKEDDIIREELILNDVDEVKLKVEKLPEVPLKTTLLQQVNSAYKQIEERKYQVLTPFVTYTGTETMEITLDGPAHLFEEIKVNDQILERSNYALQTGSTVITLKDSYLKSLKNGNYTILFTYVNEETVVSEFTVNVKDEEEEKGEEKEKEKEKNKDKNKDKDKDKKKEKKETVPTGIQNQTLLFGGVLVIAVIIVLFLFKKRK